MLFSFKLIRAAYSKSSLRKFIVCAALKSKYLNLCTCVLSVSLRTFMCVCVWRYEFFLSFDREQRSSLAKSFCYYCEQSESMAVEGGLSSSKAIEQPDNK